MQAFLYTFIKGMYNVKMSMPTGKTCHKKQLARIVISQTRKMLMFNFK